MQFRVLRVVNGPLKTFSLHNVFTAIAIFSEMLFLYKMSYLDISVFLWIDQPFVKAVEKCVNIF